MSDKETNIDDIFQNFELESDEVSDEEANLLDIFAKDPDISATADDDTEEDKTEDGKTKTPAVEKASTIVPDSEEDFVKKLGTEDDTDESDTDDADSSHDGDEGDDLDDDASVYFKTVAEGLIKLGKFDGIEPPEKWDQDSFLDFFDKSREAGIETGIDERISDKWGDEGKKIFEEIFVKGVDPREYFEKYNEILDLDSIDLEKESNQKMVVSKYLEALGQDEEEILDQIEVLEEKGKLAERAEKYKEKLVEDNKRELSRIAAEKEAAIIENKKAQQARMSAIKDVVNKAITAKEINGIPLSVTDSKDLLPFATDLNWKLANGTLITDADKALLEIKRDPIKWVALCKLLKEDLNVAPIKNKGADERADDVFNFKKTKKVKATTKDPLDLFLKRKF